ncbi:MAG: hypothetical protein ABMA02_12500 [Saprospiraceae bacterium]
MHTSYLLFFFLLSSSVRPACQTEPNLAEAASAPPPDSFVLLETLPVRARFATADNLGNVYLVTAQNALEKYAPGGRLLARYSNNRLGQAAWLDVSNPMKVLAWYADFRTVVFLDRSLTLLGEINLIGAGYPEVYTVAAAADGNLWLYDEVAFQLKKTTPEGITLFESQALNLIQSERIAVAAIRDDGTQVLAADPALGVLCFDVYGQFQRILPWRGISSFVLAQNRLEHLANGVLHLEDLQALAAREIPLPDSAKEPGAQVWAAPKRLFVQGGEVSLQVWGRE